ncbi:uncharacterized protein LAESUDRAFT_574179 [Laetiporus sulphureus 93-53]|uniref:Uncharacterized protein n=1 Tax=Laetiporus sulphureus 93-53 TaxID=1314785 RepID=A0A165B207_9APHY|nr:uncharacterized protein LAESUDRAFT_574179 [Laetiporus sulphureus 93-53]KZT00080.1 hypothetical protein LAESUDRAFT_574179 [Laetiporus sulphureus 93-53]
MQGRSERRKRRPARTRASRPRRSAMAQSRPSAARMHQDRYFACDVWITPTEEARVVGMNRASGRELSRHCEFSVHPCNRCTFPLRFERATLCLSRGRPLLTCGGRSGSHVRGLGDLRYVSISYGVTELLYMLNTLHGGPGVMVRHVRLGWMWKVRIAIREWGAMAQRRSRGASTSDDETACIAEVYSGWPPHIHPSHRSYCAECRLDYAGTERLLIACK